MRLKNILKVVFFVLLALVVGLFGLIFFKEFVVKKKIPVNTVDKKPSASAPDERLNIKWGVGLNLFALHILPGDRLTDWTIAKPQIDLAKELGVSYVRIGIPDWAMNRQDELFLPAMRYIRSKGLHIVLGFDPTEGNPTKMGSKDRFKDGYKWGNEIATRYKGLVEYYQLSNEVTGTAMKPSWSGISEESFDQDKYKQILDWLKGASTGVGEADPEAKRVVTGHWLGFGFFDMAIRDGLEFEVIGWDWYGKDPDITNVKSDNKIYNIGDELSKFGKELWISETNYESGSRDGEDKQADYLSEFASNVIKDKRFSGFFPLYLTDVPTILRVDNHDGLVDVVISADKSVAIGHKKRAYYEYRKIINDAL